MIVLDDAPPELTTLVAYLEHVTDDKLVIDLVVVSNFNVNGAPVMIPQRVAPERHEAVVEQTRSTGRRTDPPHRYPGIERFETAFEDQFSENAKSVLKWARDLEERRLARLVTSIGRANQTFRAISPGERAGLVTVWRNGNDVEMTWAKSVFGRRAPDFIERVEALVEGPKSDLLPVNEGVLKLLTEAYEKASK